MTKKIGLFAFLILLVLLFFYIDGRTGNIYEKIPVEVYRHSIVVPITIEGKTYSFQLDTGAPTSISQELYFELCLNTIDSVPAKTTMDTGSGYTIASSPRSRLVILLFQI